MPASRARAALAALAGFCACADPGSDPDGPGVDVSGMVVSDADSAIAGAEVRAIVFDTSFTLSAEVTVRADGRGGFSAWVPLDTVLTAGVLRLEARAAFGSGLRPAEVERQLEFDEGGRSRPVSASMTVARSGPAVPRGIPASLEAASLSGRSVRGWTVDPPARLATFVAMFLDLQFESSGGDSLRGRYRVDYSATRVCGSGEGSFGGAVTDDTLRIRMVGDSVPGSTQPGIITDFLLVTHDDNADTLIAQEVVAPSSCGVGEIAPIRLVVY